MATGMDKLKALKASYDFTDDAVEFKALGGITLLLRREDFRNDSGHQPYQEDFEKFYKGFTLGGTRRSKPTDKEVKDEKKRLIVKHLFVPGDLTSGEFAEALADPKLDSFYTDVCLMISDRDSFKKEHAPAAAEDTNGPNS